MRKEISFDCAVCGIPTTRKRSTGDPLVCFDCGMASAAQAAREMAAKSGDAWERYSRRPGRGAAVVNTHGRQ